MFLFENFVFVLSVLMFRVVFPSFAFYILSERSSAQFSIFSSHLGFGNCVGLLGGKICRGSWRELDKIGEEDRKKNLKKTRPTTTPLLPGRFSGQASNYNSR